MNGAHQLPAVPVPVAGWRLAACGTCVVPVKMRRIPDFEAAAREIRRVLRPGAPVLIRQAFPVRVGRIGLVR